MIEDFLESISEFCKTFVSSVNFVKHLFWTWKHHFCVNSTVKAIWHFLHFRSRIVDRDSQFTQGLVMHRGTPAWLFESVHVSKEKCVVSVKERGHVSKLRISKLFTGSVKKAQTAAWHHWSHQPIGEKSLRRYCHNPIEGIWHSHHKNLSDKWLSAWLPFN